MTAQQAIDSLLDSDPQMYSFKARIFLCNMEGLGELSHSEAKKAVAMTWGGRRLRVIERVNVEMMDADFPGGEWWQRRAQFEIAGGY